VFKNPVPFGTGRSSVAGSDGRRQRVENAQEAKIVSHRFRKECRDMFAFGIVPAMGSGE